MICGNEAFLVLQFHGVESAAIAVDADEKGMRGCEIDHGEKWKKP